MTPTHRAFARAMACAFLLAPGATSAQSLVSGKVNTGTPSFVNDQNVPLQLDATGALRVTGGGGGGASTVSGSMEQDVRATGTLNAATLNAAITTPINGQATVGYTFTGLSGTGATLTYEQSIDGGTTWTGVNAVNRGTGAFEATRTTDGQIALSATGRTTIRVRVSTAGTGTITVTTNVSVREGIFSMGSPLPPGANVVGSVLVSANATANANGNPIFTSITNLPTAAPGTSAATALAVQGVTNGVPQNMNLLATTAAGPTPVTTTGSSVVGKNSAGNLYGFSVTASGTAAYLAILNATAAPAAGAAIAPLECIPVAVNSYVARRQDIPDRYTSGIVAVVSSSCTTFTAVAPQVVSLIVQ